MRTLTTAIIAVLIVTTTVAEDRPTHDEEALRGQYDSFVKSLNHKRIAKDYPKAVANLDSSEPKVQIAGIQTLAATEEVEAIPWIVPFLDSEDRGVRTYAGQSLLRVVASHQLKRRDKSQPDRVVIKAPGPGDLDLKPIAWVVVKMLRKPDDGNTHSYAANMAGYLGMEELTGEIQGLLDSKHPAVTNAARNALKMLGVNQANAFSKAELAAARATGESFGKLFRDKDEDNLALLLVPKELLPKVLSPDVLGKMDVDNVYGKMVSANTRRFTEFRAMCGDLSKMSGITFQSGKPVKSDFYAPDARVMKNSFVTLGYANRVEIKVKIEEMVLVDGKCYIVEID